ncbi:MAG: hypothetical protein KIS76_06100 [Pyrinomonadaceae bacterium]|nr:hypothetical protein [Pyrinomonadaceae bacterium]
MKIDQAIRLFAEFLDNSWYSAKDMLSDINHSATENSINDWMEANWELLVERKVLKPNDYLEVYGDGADYYGASSRIIDPDSLPNYQIAIKPKQGRTVYDVLNNADTLLEDVIFEKLVGFQNGFYALEPEFNFLLINDNLKGVERVVALSDVVFSLREYSSAEVLQVQK